MKNEGVDVTEIEQELGNWVDENKSLIVNKIFTLKGIQIFVGCHRMALSDTPDRF